MKYSRMKKLLADNKLILLYVFVLGVLLLIPSAIAPVFRQVYTDYILLDNARDWLPVLMALMAGMAVFSGMLTYLQRTVLQRLSNRIEIHGASSYFYHLLRSPLSRFAKADTFTLLEKANDATAISELLTKDILRTAFSLITTLLYLLMMLRIDTLMTCIVVGLILLNFAVNRLHGHIKKRIEARQSADDDGPDAEDLQQMEEHAGFRGLQSIEMIKSTASEQHFFERMMGIKNALVTATQDDDYAEAYEPTEGLPEILFMNLLLLISALRIMDREFTLGTYLAFSAYASTLFGPMSELLSLRKLFRGYEKKLRRLARNQTIPDEDLTQQATPRADAKLSGCIEVENVSFAYAEGQPAVVDFSLSAQPGQRIAIVGKSGAGKTTVMKLLQGLIAPQTGAIRYDGQPIAAIDETAYAVSVGAANQKIVIFSGSIRQNITLWDSGVTDAEVFRAADSAGLHPYIAQLTGAYDYALTENGRNLSGGQRQKLELARALLYQPSLVLLDEATSSMDPQSIAHIEEDLLRRGCTCIVTSHVIGHLTGYDEIIVLEEGHIGARGTHEELLVASPLYAQLYHAEEGRAAI